MPDQKSSVARIYMIRSACRELGVSQKTIARAIARLGIDPGRIGKKKQYIFTAEMLELIRKGLAA